MKHITLIGLALLLMGLVTISCKKSSEKSESETKKTGVLDDSTFVEIAAEQNLLIQEYQVKGQQMKSDSERTILADEFTKETKGILNKYGISRAQVDSYVKVLESDTQKAQELQEKIVSRIREKIAEETPPESQ